MITKKRARFKMIRDLLDVLSAGDIRQSTSPGGTEDASPWRQPWERGLPYCCKPRQGRKSVCLQTRYRPSGAHGGYTYPHHGLHHGVTSVAPFGAEILTIELTSGHGLRSAVQEIMRSASDGTEPRPSGSGMMIDTGPLPYGRGSERPYVTSIECHKSVIIWMRRLPRLDRVDRGESFRNRGAPPGRDHARPGC